MPLHYILTDTVLSMGGSAELVRVLNRFGVCVSPCTQNRIAARVVTHNGIQSQLLPRTLTVVVSIDNIDILHVNAMVSAMQSS